jgi:hypothetical protein
VAAWRESGKEAKDETADEKLALAQRKIAMCATTGGGRRPGRKCYICRGPNPSIGLQKLFTHATGQRKEQGRPRAARYVLGC